MIFKTKKLERSLVFLNETRDGIISYCKINHPDEMILILKGHSKKIKTNLKNIAFIIVESKKPQFVYEELNRTLNVKNVFYPKFLHISKNNEGQII